MNNVPEVVIVYDKQCPACDYYCQLVRIKESVGRLVLHDARSGGEIIERITAHGWDIDQGMVIQLGDSLYYGADAIHLLSLLSSQHDMFNKVTYWLFRYKWVSRCLYPLLKTLRNLLLKILKKTKINNLKKTRNSHF
ncbi:DCC1-like thiol-disulfide oxidoreductase family protein [Aeromonas cavernicola]|uniref:DUF393 domain-containing protein n=1 Tax=Aeromonas cavernicola TaxID=1006623 RepID=A0A2H9U5N7_9GAMM|nr:DCC1-like thiol-disulfide oxidoreductase family protein [Aeromonas cavernicola]PJG59278.1 hypothetical protein CUC53_08225 [Aeromonas cavernicola]